jgi:hypothetical protein
VVGALQESEQSTDGFGTSRLPRTGRNSFDILSGSDSVVNDILAYLDVEESMEKPEQPVDLGG